MHQNKVVSMCPKCTKIETYSSVSSIIRRMDGTKYELHTCSVCGERYLAHTFGYYSIRRFHGDNFVEQLESVLEITPEHCEKFIQQVKECDTDSELLKVVASIHGEIKPKTTKAYHQMLDTSLLITEDVWEKISE